MKEYEKRAWVEWEFCYMGKAKDRELVVLLFERWEVLRKLGDAETWCGMRPEKWLDSSMVQCWWTWLDSAWLSEISLSRLLVVVCPVSGGCWWESAPSGGSSVPLSVAIDESLSQDVLPLSTSLGMVTLLVWLVLLVLSTLGDTIELVKTAFWTYTNIWSRIRTIILFCWKNGPKISSSMCLWKWGLSWLLKI